MTRNRPRFGATDPWGGPVRTIAALGDPLDLDQGDWTAEFVFSSCEQEST